jgi:hypothetical protein
VEHAPSEENDGSTADSDLAPEERQTTDEPRRAPGGAECAGGSPDPEQDRRRFAGRLADEEPLAAKRARFALGATREVGESAKSSDRTDTVEAIRGTK